MQDNSLDRAIISDASCLIALTDINRLEILKKLYKEIIITPEVAAEYKKPLPDWIIKKDVQNRKLMDEIPKFLHGGEASSIALAMETKNSVLILDDDPARKFAIKNGITITGTLGVIAKACDAGFIDSYDDACMDLQKISFYFSKKVQEATRKNITNKNQEKFPKHGIHR